MTEYKNRNEYQGDDFDVVIIGAGASGAVAASELSAAGYKVALLEKGDWLENKIGKGFPDGERDFFEDELLVKNRRLNRPDKEDDPTFFQDNSTPYKKEKITSIGDSHNLVGGGTRLYAGAAWRLRKNDFMKRSLYGTTKGTSIIDWPIQYRDLAPYYTKAETQIQISGYEGGDASTVNDPTNPEGTGAGHYKLTHGEDRLDSFSRRLLEKGWENDLKPFGMPLAISLTKTGTNGKAPCMRAGMCSGYPCYYGAKSSVDVRLLPGAIKNGLKIYTKYMAFRIEHNEAGRATGVLCMDMETGRFVFFSAHIVILAASAIQSARLLLNSSSNLFPDGLANDSGLVGKNLMFHNYSKQLGVFKEAFPIFQLNKFVAFHDFYHPQLDHKQTNSPTDSFINHCSIQSGSRWGPIKFARKARAPNWGTEFVQRLRYEFPRTQLLQTAIEDLPQEQNRVELHESKVDMYGMPSPKIFHSYHQMDIDAMKYGLSKAAMIMQMAGAEIREYSNAHADISANNTFHYMGTCRMGFNDTDSVLNRYCQSYSVPNLFVIDGSVFPTSAAVNPTLTIQANAYRVADYIIRSVSRMEKWLRTSA